MPLSWALQLLPDSAGSGSDLGVPHRALGSGQQSEPSAETKCDLAATGGGLSFDETTVPTGCRNRMRDGALGPVNGQARPACS